MLIEAAESYLEALRVAPMMPQALNNLGNVYQLMGQSAEAVKVYKRLLSVNPGNAATRSNLAGVYIKQGRLFDARVEAAEAIRLAPDHLEARLNMALIDEKEGHREKAERGFRWVLEKRPGDARAIEGLKRLRP